MQISIKWFNIILLCCLTQTTYSATNPQKDPTRPSTQPKVQLVSPETLETTRIQITNKFIETSLPHRKTLNATIKRLRLKDIPCGLVATAKNQTHHEIITGSIDIRDEEPFQPTGTIVTTWIHNLLKPKNRQHDFTIQRTIPHVPKECTTENLFPEITSCFTFTTKGGAMCHTDALCTNVVFAQGSTPENFDTIPYLKELLTCILRYPTVDTRCINDFCYITTGSCLDIGLMRHIEAIPTPRCSYRIKRFQLKEKPRNEPHCPPIADNEFSQADNVRWEAIKNK